MNPLIQPLRDGDPKSYQGWTLEGFIAEGGQSTIYLAEKNGERAALKMIRKEYITNQKSTDRFFTEIKNLERLDHPNISRVLEVEDSGKFLAIEFIDGPNLEDYVKESGPLEVRKWFTLAQILASTVDYCHSQGVIHKDISPRNIVIGPEGPVLVDFGISYLEKDERLTADDETIGTPPFMSPEHFGIAAPKQMDVFCLGGTLIFAATGNYPFAGTNSAEWKESILFSQPNFSGLSENQIKVLSPLLYKRPEDRGSLIIFSQLLEELASEQSPSNFAKKQFAKVKRESQKRLIQDKRQLVVKRKMIKKMVASSAAISILSIGLVTYGIFEIQSNSVQNDATSSSTTGTSGNLTPVQQIKASACRDLASFEDYESAIATCKETAELGDAWSQYSLGLSLEKTGEIARGERWILASAEQELPEAMAQLASYEIARKNYNKALFWAKKSAKSGNLVGVEAVGISYSYLNKFDLAVDWFKRSWDLGDIQGARNLGYHYWFEDFNKVEAAKWLKIAAETTSSAQGATAFDYAEFLRREEKNNLDSCKWYLKSSKLKYKEGEKDSLLAFEKHCKEYSEPLRSTESPSPKGVVSTPAESKKPVASSDKFSISAPEAENVIADQIEGRVFKDGLNFWRISLTNSQAEKVPPITGIQFRLIGFKNAGWLNVPYKLKKDSKSGIANSWDGVYAEVDDLLFAIQFKNMSYCPEFRAIREENNKIIHIWNKGQPECATDYNP